MASKIDALPDEVLLLILGFVDNSNALLDVVPLVCKRWHRISKDPRAWASAVVRLNFCGRGMNCEYPKDGAVDGMDKRGRPLSKHSKVLHSRMLVSTARVILHAPSLRRLEIVGRDFYYDPDFQLCLFEARVLQSALLRSTTGLRELVLRAPRPLQLWSRTMNNQADLVMDLLDRYQHTLRAVDLASLTELALYNLTDVLESLSLSMDGLVPLRSIVSESSLNLKRLEVANYSPLEFNGYATASLVASLARGAAGSLRQLHLLQGGARLSAVDAAQVRRCEGLRGLTCCLEDAAMLPVLPQLHSLDLHTSYRFGSRLAGDLAALRAATDALLLGGPLARMRVLSVTLILPQQDKHIDRRERLRPAVESLLRALATAAPQVTHLELSLDGLSCVGLFLESMPHLQSVVLWDFAFSPSVMVLLAKLPELTELIIDPESAACPAERLFDPDFDGCPESIVDPSDKASEDMTVGDALASLRSVRTLRLRFCSEATLPVLATLPELKNLVADVVFYDEGGRSRWEAAIADFGRQRPDVSYFDVRMWLLKEF